VTESLRLVFDALTAGGSTLALGLIVTLALGIAVLTLLFVGSAVVALEQLARSARSPARIFMVAVAWAVVAGFVSLDTARPELAVASWRDWLVGYAEWTGTLGVAVALMTGLAAFLLRATCASRRALVATAWLGRGYAALVGGVAGEALRLENRSYLIDEPPGARAQADALGRRGDALRRDVPDLHPFQADAQVRADCLRSRGAKAHRRVSMGVASRPRSTMSKR